ncbi:MAG: exodeoxyribonuclease VII small subunit, partial [Candidatus Nomurabacteria bacterium]|nr:exodeoxyribonuclease VII small subunit [Candidatus Nomurabacteria bacterium]
MSSNQKSLRALMDEFEAVVAWFEGDSLDVEEAIRKFKEGSELAEQIKRQLAEAKNEIKIVKEKFGATDS